MSLDRLAQEILEKIGEEVFRSRAPHILAVSGGRDSMLLLRLYHHLWIKGSLPLSPVVFHMNHGLRESARLDEELLLAECKRMDLALFLHRVDVGRFARRSGMGLEEAGRHLRYRQLKRLCHLYPGSIAVTAHHADDYLESVLLHMIRGGGEASFHTMDLFGRVGGTDLFRPFLLFSRETLDRIVRTCSVPFLEDESNASDRFLRNRIRKVATPFLKREGLDPAGFWSRMHDRELSRPVGGELAATDHLRLDGALFRFATGSEIKRLLDLAFRRLELPPASRGLVLELYRQLARQRSEGGLRIHLEREMYELWSGEKGPLWILRKDAKLLRPLQMQSLDQAAAAVSPMETGEGEVARIREGGVGRENRCGERSGELFVAYNGIKRRYRLRSNEQIVEFRDGMVYRLPRSEGEGPSFRGGTKKLKKLFQELRIPPSVRRRIPLIENARNGYVTAVCLSFLEGMRDLRFPAGEDANG